MPKHIREKLPEWWFWVLSPKNQQIEHILKQAKLFKNILLNAKRIVKIAYF
jgi:hypothetical protein